MSIATRHPTYRVEDLEALDEQSGVELHEGAIVMNAQPLTRHQLVTNAVLAWLLVRRTGAMFGLGIRFPGDLESLFVPDVTVVRDIAAVKPLERWLEPGDVELVVEVLSPSTRRADYGVKRDTYAGAGIAYWVIDAEAERIERSNDTTGLDVEELATSLW